MRAVRAAAEIDGPVYIRLGFLTPIDGYDAPFEVGEAVTMREGDDAADPATGGCVQYGAAGARRVEGQPASRRGVINMHTLKPLDRAAVERARRARPAHLVTVEEHFDHRRPRRRGRRDHRRARRRPPRAASASATSSAPRSRRIPSCCASTASTPPASSAPCAACCWMAKKPLMLAISLDPRRAEVARERIAVWICQDERTFELMPPRCATTCSPGSTP